MVPTAFVKFVFKSAGQSSWEAIWAIRWVFLVSTMNTANYRIRGRSLHTVLMKKKCNPEPQEQTPGQCMEAFSWCSTEPAQEAALDATHLPGCKAGRGKRIDKFSICFFFTNTKHIYFLWLWLINLDILAIFLRPSIFLNKFHHKLSVAGYNSTNKQIRSKSSLRICDCVC